MYGFGLSRALGLGPACVAARGSAQIAGSHSDDEPLPKSSLWGLGFRVWRRSEPSKTLYLNPAP